MVRQSRQAFKISTRVKPVWRVRRRLHRAPRKTWETDLHSYVQDRLHEYVSMHVREQSWLAVEQWRVENRGESFVEQRRPVNFYDAT